MLFGTLSSNTRAPRSLSPSLRLPAPRRNWIRGRSTLALRGPEQLREAAVPDRVISIERTGWSCSAATSLHQLVLAVGCLVDIGDKRPSTGGSAGATPRRNPARGH